jgi:hypothetical protein
MFLAYPTLIATTATSPCVTRAQIKVDQVESHQNWFKCCPIIGDELARGLVGCAAYMSLESKTQC